MGFFFSLILLLGRTCVVGGTKTGVVVDAVDAGRSVLAVVVLAVVHVGFAGGALEACETRATAKTQGAQVRLVALRNEGRNPPKTPPLDPLPHLYSPPSSTGSWQVPPLAHGLLTQAFSAVSQFLPWDTERQRRLSIRRRHFATSRFRGGRVTDAGF